MKRRTFLSMIVPATTLLTGCSGRPFYFIQMADTQIGMIAGGKDGNNFGKETEILELVISQINRMIPSPDFVVVCGDMTNSPFHAKQINEYKRLMGLLNDSIPLYNVSGNHDFDGLPEQQNIDFYREIYGADWYAFECRGVNFIVLNSMLMNFPESCQGEADVQFKWLETKLRKTTHANKQGTVIFMHHLFFDNTIDEDDGYFSIKKAYRRKYLDLFAANNVRAVFSGHRHTTIPERNYKGVCLINTNAICNSFDNKPGLRIVRVVNNQLMDTYHRFDALPVNVVFSEVVS